MPDSTDDPMSPLAAGDAIGTSEWFRITQAMITSFGETTLDPDPMHIDPEWALANGPYGGSIAFGFLTFAMLTRLLYSALRNDPARDPGRNGFPLNYGFDRARLIEPVSAGARIRGHFKLKSHKLDDKQRWRSTIGAEVEIEDGTRPALVADWLTIWQPPAVNSPT